MDAENSLMFSAVKAKIASILHDPLDKVIEIKNHAKRASDYALYLFGIRENEILEAISRHHDYDHDLSDLTKTVRIADINASAANRALILKSETNIVEDNVLIYHPLSTVELFRFRDINRKLLIENLLREIKDKKSVEDAKVKSQKISLDLFNSIFSDLPLMYYSEIGRVSGGFSSAIRRFIHSLPEDSRMPVTSILSHLQMTSAISTIIEHGGNFLLAYVDFGGIQEFIKHSRKTTDLWASSYIVSLLIFYVIKKISDVYGPDMFIIPWLPSIPLAKATIFKKHVYLNDLLYSQVPNSFLVLIPCTINADSSPPNEVAKKIIDDFYSDIRSHLKDALNKIIDIAKDYLEERSQNKEKIKDVFTELSLEDIIGKIRLSGIVCSIKGNHFVCYNEAYSKLKENEEIGMTKIDTFIQNNSSYVAYERWKAFKDFSTLVKILQKAMFIAKYRFATKKRVVSLKRKKDLCTLCNTRKAIDDEAIKCLRSIIPGLLDYDERLCGVCLLKRIFPYILYNVFIGLFPETEKTVEDIKSIYKGKIFRVPSTVDLGTIWFKATVLMLMDNDNLRTLINKLIEKLEDLEAIAKKIKNFNVKDSDLETILDLLTDYDREIIRSVPLINEIVKLYGRDNSSKIFANMAGELLITDNLDNYARVIRKVINKINQGKIKVANKEVIEYLELLAKYLERSKDHEKCDNYRGILNELFKAVEKIISNEKDRLIEKFFKVVVKMGFFDEYSTLWFKVEKLGIPFSKAPQNRFVILMTDGDDMGKIIGGEKNPPIIFTYSREKYWNVIEDVLNKENKDDLDVLLNPLPLSPGTLAALSSIISEHSYVVKKIVDSFGGFLVYSGGDDVLALLPPETWYLVYFLLRFTFSAEFLSIILNEEISLTGERLTLEKNKLGMSWRATSSFGIVIAHSKYDFRRAIERARELLEEKAKKLTRGNDDRPLKDGLSIEILTRSGAIESVDSVPNLLINYEEGDRGKLYYIKEYDQIIHDTLREIIHNIIKKNNTKDFSPILRNIIPNLVEKKLLGGSAPEDTTFYGIFPAISQGFALMLRDKIDDYEISDFHEYLASKIKLPTVISPLELALRVVKLINEEAFSNRIIYDLIDLKDNYEKLKQKSDEYTRYLYYMFSRALRRRLKNSSENVLEEIEGMLLVLLRLFVEDANLIGIPTLVKILYRVLSNTLIVVRRR